jgi:chaperonin GroEL
MVLLEGDEFRQEIKRCLEVASQVVGSTMGKHGGNVHIVVNVPHRNEQGQVTYEQRMQSSKDGISIGQSLANTHEDANVRQVLTELQRSIDKQWKEVGDGTTTATVLTSRIFGLMCEVLSLNPEMKLRDIDALFESTIEGIQAELLKQRKFPKDSQKLIQIATTSANNIAEIGKIVGETVWAAGKYGIVTSSIDPNIEGIMPIVKTGCVLQGAENMQWLTAIGATHAFVSPSKNKPKVILTTDVLDNYKAFVEKIFPAYNAINKGLTDPNDITPFIVICRSVDSKTRGDILANQEFRKSKGQLPHHILFVDFQEAEDKMFEYLEDLSAITGATIYSKHRYNNPIAAKFDASGLGEVLGFKMTAAETVVHTCADTEKVANHAKEIEKELESDDTDISRKEWLNRRLAMLLGCFAFIRVGATTASEMLDRDDLVDDAVRNASVALKEGYVLGGGVALAKCWDNETPLDLEICSCILGRLRQNAETTIVGDAHGYEYDLDTGEPMDYEAAGILDSYLSQKMALNVAFSHARTLFKCGYGFLPQRGKEVANG